MTSVFTLVGIAFGSFLTRRSARDSAQETLRQQRRLEGDRRRDDRKAKLYEDLLATLGTVSRASNSPEPDNHKVSELIDAMATIWSSRVDLYASAEVRAVFENWFDGFVKYWNTWGKEPRSAEELERWQAWERRMVEAREQLPVLMRTELQSWDS